MPLNDAGYKEFGLKERETAALLVRSLLKREGLESDVRCSAGGLSIFLRGTSDDFGLEGTIRLLCLLIAIAQTMDEEHNVGNDFVIWINLWKLGYMVTTVGKAGVLAGRMKTSYMTAEDFWEAFEFCTHEISI